MKSLTATNKHSNRYKLYIFATASLAILAIFIASWIVAQRPASAVQKDVQTSLDMTTATAPAPGTFPPSNGFTTTKTSLTQKVDSTSASSLQKEATAISMPDSVSASVDLTLDSDWKNKLVDARFYAPASTKADEANVAWPLISFSTFDDGTASGGDNDFTGFRIYDTNGDATQKWYNLTDLSFEWGKTYNLKISYNATTDNYDFYIDGNLVKSLYASHNDGDNAPRGTIRAGYYAAVNSATGDSADDYSVKWSNAKYGVMTEVSDTATFPAAKDGKQIMLTTPAGTTITDTSTQKVSTKHADKTYEYPAGLVSFSYTTENSSDEISLVFVTNHKPSEVVARKYNPTDHSYTTIDGAKISKTTLDGKAALKVTYTIKDNGPLDLNSKKGEVTDPVGLAVSTVGVPNTGAAQQNLFPIAIVSIFGLAAVVSSIAVSIKRRSVFGK